MFDEAKLEASQRALSHCVDFLRCCAAAESNRTLVAGSGLETSVRRPWLSEKPEELCVALRACVDIVRGGGGARRGPRFGKDREGESDRYGQLPFFAIFFRLSLLLTPRVLLVLDNSDMVSCVCGGGG